MDCATRASLDGSPASRVRFASRPSLVPADEAWIAAEHPRYELRGSHEGLALSGETEVIFRRLLDVARRDLLLDPVADLVPFTETAPSERLPEPFGRLRRLPSAW
jgi:hypothetical protein